MTMTPAAIALWLANMLFDSAGQLAFKAAAREPVAGVGFARWRYMAARPWLWLGLASYVCCILVWMAFLSLVPLSLGVLLSSINIVVLMLASRWIFAERLSRLHLLGILLIAAGVGAVGSGP